MLAQVRHQQAVVVGEGELVVEEGRGSAEEPSLPEDLLAQEGLVEVEASRVEGRADAGDGGIAVAGRAEGAQLVELQLPGAAATQFGGAQGVESVVEDLAQRRHVVGCAGHGAPFTLGCRLFGGEPGEAGPQFVAQVIPDARLEVGVGQHEDVLAQFAGAAQEVDQALFETVAESVGGMEEFGQHGQGRFGGGGTIPENGPTG